MAGKYIHGELGFQKQVPKPSSWNLWKGLVAASEILRKGNRKRVHDGRDTLFWRDTWSGDSPLLNLAMKPVPMADSYKCVSAYWSSGEGWNWSSLAGLLPNQIEDLLHVVLLRQCLEGRDNICWGFTNDGRFTIKSAYLATLTCNCSHPSIEWKRIWKLQDPLRIRTFLWLIHHRKIITNLERARRGFTGNSYCQACPTSNEDLDHVFRFYTTTATLWKKIGDMERTTYPQNLTFVEWFSWNLNEPMTTFADGEWSLFFAICIWLIWKWRNECTFNGSKIP